METIARGRTLGEIASFLGGQLNGPPDLIVVRPVPAGIDDPEGITFAESAEYLARATETKVGAIIVDRESPLLEVPTIAVDNPRVSFSQVLSLFRRPLPISPGIHPTAVVDSQAHVSQTASIGAYAVVESGAKVGDGSRIFPFAYIGEGCVIGSESTVYPHAVLYQDVHVGDRCIIHAGVIIGADGFGFHWDSKEQRRRVKVPQVGGVHIGNDVEIGALTAVDRATAGQTTIGHGTKLDNLVQVGHNCSVGDHTVIAGQTAIGGSSKVGAKNEIGGQVAISDHVKITDNVMLAGRTGVMNDIAEPGVYWGLPARPISVTKRILAATLKLPQILKRVADLERRLQEIDRERK